MSPAEAAELFFPHLWPNPFLPTQEALEADIDANFDRNGDDEVCIRIGWGDTLNPNSHWSRVGLEGPLGEPVYSMWVNDNTANANQ